MSIALLEAKCKSINAIYQLRPKPIRQLPGASSHSIRFSGSPNPELNHIFEVTEARNRAFVMVFSSSLRFDDDYQELARGVNEINRKSDLGMWMYEEKPGLKQFCFLVTVELGFSSSNAIKTEVLWQTIVYLDSAYKEQVQQLAEYQLVTHRITPAASLSGFPASFVNSLVSQLEGIYGKTTCQPKAKALHLSFTGHFNSERLGGKCDKFLAELRIGPEVYEALIFFCDLDTPAVFTPLHRTMALLQRLNRFNAALGVGCFVYFSNENIVAFRYKCYWRDYQLAQLPSNLRALFSTLTTKLPVYFESIQKYYLHPNQAETTVGDSSVPEHSEYHLFEQQYNSVSFIKELAELTRLEQSQAGKHLLGEAYDVKAASSSVIRKVHRALVPLAAMWEEDLVPSQEEIGQVLEVMRDLKDSKAYYSNLNDLMYFMREGSCYKVVLIPYSLYANRTDCRVINALMAKISSQMHKFVVSYKTSITQKVAISQLSAPSFLHPSYLSSPSPGQFTLGSTQVDLTTVLSDPDCYGELHNVMYQVQVFGRRATAPYHLTVYGLTTLDGKVSLVTEKAGNCLSLSRWIRTKSGKNERNREQIRQGLLEAVRTLHRAGIFQLFLSPESIKIRELATGCVPVLPAVPLLMPSSLSAVLHYSAPEVFASLSSLSHWETLNWQAADAYSCLLLCYHIHSGRFPDFAEEFPECLPALRQSARCREVLLKAAQTGQQGEALEPAWNWLSRCEDMVDFLTQRTK